jgi:hypothetical protein
MSIQTSLLGQPIPLGWGRARLSCNLGDYLAFTAIPHTTTTKTGGKGRQLEHERHDLHLHSASSIWHLRRADRRHRHVYKDSATFVAPGLARPASTSRSAPRRKRLGLSDVALSEPRAGISDARLRLCAGL